LTIEEICAELLAKIEALAKENRELNFKKESALMELNRMSDLLATAQRETLLT